LVSRPKGRRLHYYFVRARPRVERRFPRWGNRPRLLEWIQPAGFF
jgi:hypothetical protein